MNYATKKIIYFNKDEYNNGRIFDFFRENECHSAYY